MSEKNTYYKAKSKKAKIAKVKRTPSGAGTCKGATVRAAKATRKRLNRVPVRGAVVGVCVGGTLQSPAPTHPPRQAAKLCKAKQAAKPCAAKTERQALPSPTGADYRFYILALAYKMLSDFKGLASTDPSATLESLSTLASHTTVSALTAAAPAEAEFNQMGGWGLPTDFQFRYHFSPPKFFKPPTTLPRRKKTMPNLLPTPVRGSTPYAVATKALNSLAVPRLPQGCVIAPSASEEAATARLERDKKTWQAFVNLRKASIPITAKRKPSAAEYVAFALALVGVIEVYPCSA